MLQQCPDEILQLSTLKYAAVGVSYCRNRPHLSAENYSDGDIHVGWNNRPWHSRGFHPPMAPEEGRCSSPALRRPDVSPWGWRQQPHRWELSSGCRAKLPGEGAAGGGELPVQQPGGGTGGDRVFTEMLQS